VRVCSWRISAILPPAVFAQGRRTASPAQGVAVRSMVVPVTHAAPPSARSGRPRPEPPGRARPSWRCRCCS